MGYKCADMSAPSTSPAIVLLSSADLQTLKRFNVGGPQLSTVLS